MSLVVAVLLCAAAVGRLRGGSAAELGRTPLRSRGLVVAALVAQVAGTVGGGPLHGLGLALSTALALAFLARNRGLAGTGLAGAGLLANLVVVGLNGAMPVSLAAAERAGAPVEDLLAGADPRHELIGGATRLRWLGDVVPVRLPLRPEVVSVGDVLVAAGLGQLVVTGMLGRTGSGRTGSGRTGSGRTGRRVPPPLPPWTPSARRPRPASTAGE